MKVRWTIEKETADTIRKALKFLVQTSCASQALTLAVAEARRQLPKPELEQCADCEDAECDLDAEFYATPCGSQCEECMAAHVKECRVCCSEFSEQFPEEWDVWERKGEAHV